MSAIGVAALGVLGAAIPETMRVIALLRRNKTPKRRELLASALSALLGLGVLLFETQGLPRLQIAVLGSAFPQLFSGLVAMSTESRGTVTRGRPSQRRVVDYLAWRF